MLIHFTKMQGAGNDFIMIDNRQLGLSTAQKIALARQYCTPKIGIGADGAIFLEQDRDAMLAWDFYNADGSSAEMCGNGARCFAVFAVQIGATTSPFTFRTLAGAIKAVVTGVNRAAVQLTAASNYQKFPDLVFTDHAGDVPNTVKFTGYFINTGVPHLVIPVAAIDQIDVQKIGSFFRNHQHFAPRGTNVNFIEIRGTSIFIRTYERGVEAETLACGTGAVAAAIIAGEITASAGEKTSPDDMGEQTVYPRSGDELNIRFRKTPNGYDEIFLEGAATVVFHGEFFLN